MEGEREQTRDQNERSEQQQPIGQQDQRQQEFDQSTHSSSGSEPPRSDDSDKSSEQDTGLQGQSATGQSDLERQADTTLAGRSDKQDLGQDQPGSTGGASGGQGGFVGSQDQDSGEYLQQSRTPESGFAEQGRGASNDGSDVEGSSQSAQDSDSGDQGSSDNT